MDELIVPKEHVVTTRRILEGETLNSLVKEGKSQGVKLFPSRLFTIVHQTCRRVNPEAYEKLLSIDGQIRPSLESLRKNKKAFLGRDRYMPVQFIRRPKAIDLRTLPIDEREVKSVGTTELRAKLRKFLLLTGSGRARIEVLNRGLIMGLMIPVDEASPHIVGDENNLGIAKRYRADEFRSQMRFIFERVAVGETFVVCQFDKPVAVLVPPVIENEE